MKIKVAGQTLNLTGDQFIRRIEAGDGKGEWEFSLNGAEMMKLAHGTEITVVLNRFVGLCPLEDITVTNVPCFDQDGNPVWKNRTLYVGDNLKFLRPPPYEPTPERWLADAPANLGVDLIYADPPFNTGKTWRGNLK